jgi:hypothetical protein
MRFTRITVDLSRAVPMVPCTVTARAVRDGRRVQSLEAVIEADGKVVSRAFGTRIRVEPGLVPDEKVAPLYPEDESPAWVEDGTTWSDETAGSFHSCLEVVEDWQEDRLGGVTWIRLQHPLVAGEEPSPLVRLGSVADLVQSASARLGPDWMAINPEVSLQIEREPVGEWIALNTTVRLGDDGIGVSEATVFDRERRVGRTAKSTLNVRR